VTLILTGCYRITAYLKLVVLSFGFQHAVKTGFLSRGPDILRLSIDAAMTVIQIAVERLYPTKLLRYAMEANFLYVSFAAAYLVNVCLLTFFSPGVS
jgi:transcriptional regulatory protein LEU3